MVLLLNADFMPLNEISIKKAVRLISKQKVEIIKHTGEKIHEKMYKPKIIRLLQSINHLYNRKIPWSKQNILIRDEYHCQYCGIDLNHKTASIDHIIPKSKGGKNSWLNTVCSCKNCNSYKGDKNLEDCNLQLIKKPRIPNLLDFLIIKSKAFNYEI